eukprot:403331084
MKRLLSLTLAVALLIGTTTFVSADQIPPLGGEQNRFLQVAPVTTRPLGPPPPPGGSPPPLGGSTLPPGGSPPPLGGPPPPPGGSPPPTGGSLPPRPSGSPPPLPSRLLEGVEALDIFGRNLPALTGQSGGVPPTTVKPRLLIGGGGSPTTVKPPRLLPAAIGGGATTAAAKPRTLIGSLPTQKSAVPKPPRRNMIFRNDGAGAV